MDTNVVLRNEVVTDPLCAEVHGALEALVGRGDQLCIGFQVLAEFWAVATRDLAANGLGLDASDARRGVESTLRAYALLADTRDMARIWL